MKFTVDWKWSASKCPTLHTQTVGQHTKKANTKKNKELYFAYPTKENDKIEII